MYSKFSDSIAILHSIIRPIKASNFCLNSAAQYCRSADGWEQNLFNSFPRYLFCTRTIWRIGCIATGRYEENCKELNKFCPPKQQRRCIYILLLCLPWTGLCWGLRRPTRPGRRWFWTSGHRLHCRGDAWFHNQSTEVSDIHNSKALSIVLHSVYTVYNTLYLYIIFLQGLFSITVKNHKYCSQK